MILILAGAILSALLLYWAFRVGGSRSTAITPDQIKIEKGDKTVVVNENGVVEYRSKSGVYFDYWDSERTRSFFEFVRQKAREYLSSPPAEENSDGYYITLYLDGNEVKIWVSGDEEIITQVFDADPNDFVGNDSSLDEYFDDYFNPSPTSGVVSLLTPTQTPSGPGVVSANDGQSPGSSGGTSGIQPPNDCSLFTSQVSGRTIISNTLCVNENQ